MRIKVSEEVGLLGLSKSAGRLQRKHYAKLLLKNLGKVMSIQQAQSLEHRWSKARGILLELMEQLPRQVATDMSFSAKESVETHEGECIEDQ